MVIYEDMLHDGIWRESNLYLEDGCLYANLSGTEWIVLARNVETYAIHYEMGTLIVKFKPSVMDGFKSLFRIIDSAISIAIICNNNKISNFWTNPYKNYLDVEKSYLESEKKVVERLNSQTMYN